MNAHVTKVCQAIHFHLRNIGKVRKYLDFDTTTILVHSLVTSRLDYCNSLLLGVPKQTLNRLHMVQNHAARLITLSKRRDHVQPILKSLHWLPIAESSSVGVQVPAQLGSKILGGITSKTRPCTAS